MRRFQAALFDWDGTLFASRELNYGAVVAIFRKFGLAPPTEHEYFSKISGDFMGFYHSHGIPADIGPDELNEIRTSHTSKGWRFIPLYNDAIPALRRIKKMVAKIGIISGELSDTLEERTEGRNIDHLLNFVIGSVRDKKIAILEMLEMYNIRPEECFMVDDSPKDLIKIKESGVFTVGITHGFGSRIDIEAAKPDLIADSLTEIAKFVDGIKP